MKPIKIFGLAALAALLAMAFAGASSAMAESTALCSSESLPCEAIGHIHETTLSGAKGKLLTSVVNVECDVLFLGDTTEKTSNPLIVTGTFTYTNCGNCTVEEVGGGVEIKVLKLGHETSDVTGEGEVHVNCSGLNCTYNGEGLLGTGKGPLLSSETNGSVTITEQVAKKVSGLFCPSTSKLDIVTTPLEATYLVAGLHYCVDYEHGNNGFYANSTCTERATTQVKLYELVVAAAGFAVNEVLCVDKRVKNGLWKVRNLGICEQDNAIELNAELYEKGKITTVK